MGQVFHGSAATTEVIRGAIQNNSQESEIRLAMRYGANLKTITKWQKRNSFADLPTGPTGDMPPAEAENRYQAMLG